LKFWKLKLLNTKKNSVENPSSRLEQVEERITGLEGKVDISGKNR
jgi:hypothetical protein